MAFCPGFRFSQFLDTDYRTQRYGKLLDDWRLAKPIHEQTDNTEEYLPGSLVRRIDLEGEHIARGQVTTPAVASAG